MLQLLNLLAALGAVSCETTLSPRSWTDPNFNVYILERVSCEPNRGTDACLRATLRAGPDPKDEQRCRGEAVAGRGGEHECLVHARFARLRKCVPKCKMRVREVVRGPAVSSVYVMHCSQGVDERTATYLYVTPKELSDGQDVPVGSCYFPEGSGGSDTLLRREDAESFGFQVAYWRTLTGFRDGVCLNDLIRLVSSGTAAEREAAMKLMFVAGAPSAVVETVCAAMLGAPPEAFHGPNFRGWYIRVRRAYLARQRRHSTATADMKKMVEHLVSAYGEISVNAPMSHAHGHICGHIRAVHQARLAGLPDLNKIVEACPTVYRPE